MSIDGKRFDHVRGISKFYMQVPNTNEIIFVVDESNHSVTFHVFNLDTGEDISISASSATVFGSSIGSSDARETISVTDDGFILLCNTDQYAKSTLPALEKLHTVKSLYYLDLKKRKVVTEKTIYYDQNGNILRPDG